MEVQAAAWEVAYKENDTKAGVLASLAIFNQILPKGSWQEASIQEPVCEGEEIKGAGVRERFTWPVGSAELRGVASPPECQQLMQLLSTVVSLAATSAFLQVVLQTAQSTPCCAEDHTHSFSDQKLKFTQVLTGRLLIWEQCTHVAFARLHFWEQYHCIYRMTYPDLLLHGRVSACFS